MTIANKLREVAPQEFLDACKSLSNDERFIDNQEMIPFAAMLQVLIFHTERLALRTEIECKHEIYHALGKQPPPDNQLLRYTS